MPAARARLALTALAVVFVAAAGVAALTLLRAEEREVRYEIETAGGSTRLITWTGSDGRPKTLEPDGPAAWVETPWSATEIFTTAGTRVSVGTDLATKTEVATCRIFIDGRKVAESTFSGGAICEAQLP